MSEAATSTHRRNVVVVDDNVDTADSVALLLDVLGAHVRVAHDGHAALALLDQTQPDIVLIDLVMPEMSGIELATRIGERFPGHAMHLVACTGVADADVRREAHAAGFATFLLKTVPIAAYQQVLDAIE